jgi:hypothetical protein
LWLLVRSFPLEQVREAEVSPLQTLTIVLDTHLPISSVAHTSAFILLPLMILVTAISLERALARLATISTG